MGEYKRTGHSKHLVQYHIIWCPKFRFEVLTGDVESVLKDIIKNISKEYKYEIKALEVMPDHIHLFVATKPTVAPTDVVRTIKSITAVKLFKEFPELKNFYSRVGSLWSKGYFVSTVGNVSEKTVQKYIENQKQNQ